MVEDRQQETLGLARASGSGHQGGKLHLAAQARQAQRQVGPLAQLIRRGQETIDQRRLALVAVAAKVRRGDQEGCQQVVVQA
ncbi:hypothetical protein C1H69_22125 [Billgrantia endophytica]|uniref:Uncharacterized protein n=1 Tax=Billgrantia endophytica TaxID=2033802 RepID=A0A2N7TV69_9GAMM|nr:hypothetical protein C1H69_22125 [Halomonas endophytica]